MKTVRLYGVLARKFGREFKFDVASPQEAIRALAVQIPGFKRHLVEYSAPGYTVRTGTEFRTIEELGNPVGKTEVIKISPALAGSGSVGRIILGIALVAVAIFVPMAAPFALAAAGVGLGLTVSGVGQLLAPTPKGGESTERPENRPSYAFDGPVNTMTQGNPVPVGYGRLIVGSAVISAQMLSENYQSPIAGAFVEAVQNVQRGFAIGGSK